MPDCLCPGCSGVGFSGCPVAKANYQANFWSQKGSGHRDEIRRLTSQRDRYRAIVKTARNDRRAAEMSLAEAERERSLVIAMMGALHLDGCHTYESLVAACAEIRSAADRVLAGEANGKQAE